MNDRATKSGSCRQRYTEFSGIRGSRSARHTRTRDTAREPLPGAPAFSLQLAGALLRGELAGHTVERIAMADDLRETIHLATQGDGAAVDELLLRYLPEVQRFLARQAGQLVRAKESAADLAQSVCREVLERIGDGRFEYQGEAAFKRWLFQAAEHKMQNKHRFYKADRRDGAKEVWPAGDDDSTGAGEPPGRVTSPSKRAARAEDRLALENNLRKLPEQQSAVVRRFHFEQQSHKEIAEALDITESHSRVLLARGMARLARLGIQEEE